MSGTAIAAEVHQALIEAATDTGAGQLTATLHRPGAETGPPHNRQRGPKTQETVTILAIDYRESEIDGERVQVNDRRFLVSTIGPSAPPNVGDALTVGSEGYLILNVMPLAPGGVNLMWKVQARGPWAEP